MSISQEDDFDQLLLAVFVRFSNEFALEANFLKYWAAQNLNSSSPPFQKLIGIVREVDRDRPPHHRKFPHHFLDEFKTMIKIRSLF